MILTYHLGLEATWAHRTIAKRVVRNSDLLSRLLNLENNNNQEIANEIDIEDIKAIQHKASKSKAECRSNPFKFYYCREIEQSKLQNGVDYRYLLANNFNYIRNIYLVAGFAKFGF